MIHIHLDTDKMKENERDARKTTTIKKCRRWQIQMPMEFLNIQGHLMQRNAPFRHFINSVGTILLLTDFSICNKFHSASNVFRAIHELLVQSY